MKWLPVTLGMAVLVLSLGVAVVTMTNRAGTSSNQDIRSQAAELGGTMRLSPAGGDYAFSAEQTYPVGIIVDSGGKTVDGVDVIIHFDPEKVQVVEAMLPTTTLFERFPLNRVDNQTGLIQLSALTFHPAAVTGILATFSFRPRTVGQTTFSFEFSPGATADSNIAEHGTAKDVLGKVENATFNFR